MDNYYHSLIPGSCAGFIREKSWMNARSVVVVISTVLMDVQFLCITVAITV